MSIWNKKFNQPSAEFPERVVLKIIEPFENAAEKLASLKLVRLESIARMSSNLASSTFQFKLVLVSDSLKGYSFEVLKFGYDVTLYPTKVIFEDDIAKELGVNIGIFGENISAFSSQEEFKQAIETALTTKKFSETVGGLIKVAKKMW